MSENKIDTLMNVMIQIVEEHFEKDCAPFDISHAGNYGDSDFVFLKSFMDQLCIHLGDNGESIFKYDSEKMEIVREE
eukprot:SAG11_NODE_6184_length_1369_cov_5.533858_2_plen_77_part_00